MATVKKAESLFLDINSADQQTLSDITANIEVIASQ